MNVIGQASVKISTYTPREIKKLNHRVL